MLKLLCKLFIKDYLDVDDPKVREKYGTVISIFSIACNILLVVFKLIMSFVTNSVAIRADGLNNLSDVGSNVATLFGFKLSNKHSDADHPYGHGRMEYVSGMIVSFLILYMGIQSLIDAIKAIISPEAMQYSLTAIIVLIASIGVKMVMGFVNNEGAKEICSESLKAAGQDSFNDTLTTFSTLVSLLVFKFTSINIDAYIGVVVSIIVIKAGVGIFIDVMNTILGKAPDKDLIKEIEKTIMRHKNVIGIHDLLLHDYGPSHQFMSLHCEVDAAAPVIELHDMVDNIENEILKKYGILTTIHMDPIDTKDELAKDLKIKVWEAVQRINPQYNIHDFRIVRGTTHTNLVFDVLLPAGDKNDHEELKKEIKKQVKKIDKTYNCVIQIDHSFV